MSALGSFFSLTPGERRAVVLVVAMVPLVKGSLRWRGYAATARLLERIARPRTGALDEARKRAHLAQRAMTRLPFHLTCLERALVVRCLSGGGPAAQIRFGVQPADDDDTPRFHAWVEMDGEFLDDGSEDPSAYLPLTPPESSAQLGRFE